MRLPMKSVRRFGALALGTLLATAAGAQGAAYEPPTFSYGEGRIELLEAVRLTLAHDPNLLLDREDVVFRQGVLQEISGSFDWTLDVGVSYDYREQRLRDSTIEREREKRNDLTTQRDFACAEEQRQRESLANLQRYAGGDTGAPIPNDVRQQIDFLDALIAAEDNATQRALLVEARKLHARAQAQHGTCQHARDAEQQRHALAGAIRGRVSHLVIPLIPPPE